MFSSKQLRRMEHKQKKKLEGQARQTLTSQQTSQTSQTPQTPQTPQTLASQQPQQMQVLQTTQTVPIEKTGKYFAQQYAEILAKKRQRKEDEKRAIADAKAKEIKDSEPEFLKWLSLREKHINETMLPHLLEDIISLAQEAVNAQDPDKKQPSKSKDGRQDNDEDEDNQHGMAKHLVAEPECTELAISPKIFNTWRSYEGKWLNEYKTHKVSGEVIENYNFFDKHIICDLVTDHFSTVYYPLSVFVPYQQYITHEHTRIEWVPHEHYSAERNGRKLPPYTQERLDALIQKGIVPSFWNRVESFLAAHSWKFNKKTETVTPLL